MLVPFQQYYFYSLCQPSNYIQFQQKKMIRRIEKRYTLPQRNLLSNQQQTKRLHLILTKQKRNSENSSEKSSEGKQNLIKNKVAYENKEKSVIKLGKNLTRVKAPHKLRLSEEHPSRNKSVLKNNTFQNGESRDTISKSVKSQILLLLFERKLIQKGYSNNVILNLQTLEMIINKFIGLFDEQQPVRISQQLSFLNSSMQRLKQLNLFKIRQRKNKRLMINAQIDVKFSTNQINRAIRNLEDELQQLKIHRSALLEQNQLTQDRIQQITLILMQKRMALQQQMQKISTIRRQFQEEQQQKITLQAKLKQLRSDEGKIQAEVQRIIHFVDDQNKNMHVRNASRNYLEIESEIFEYAVYLQANQSASSLQFQSIPLKNQIYVIQHLEKTIKDLNKNLVSNSQLSIEDKGRMMRDFVIDLNNQYRKKDEEQQKAIEFKTKCIRKFIEMMKLWVDNWTLKQEFLVDLKKQFAFLASSFDQQFSNLFTQKLCTNCSIHTLNLRQKIQQNYKRMKQNYSLGNSFY